LSDTYAQSADYVTRHIDPRRRPPQWATMRGQPRQREHHAARSKSQSNTTPSANSFPPAWQDDGWRRWDRRRV